MIPMLDWYMNSQDLQCTGTQIKLYHTDIHDEDENLQESSELSNICR